MMPRKRHGFIIDKANARKLGKVLGKIKDPGIRRSLRGIKAKPEPDLPKGRHDDWCTCNELHHMLVDKNDPLC